MRAVAAALLAAAAVAPAAAVGAVGQPTIRYATTPTFVVDGSGFKTGEQVTVIVSSNGFHVAHAVVEDGTFRASFGRLKPAACHPVRIIALGSRGSRVTLALPGHICPVLLPPPPFTTGAGR